MQRPFAPELEAAMPTYPAEILFAVFVVLVMISLIIVGTVKLFLGILDNSRKSPRHTFRRIR
jgi:hypothetical protein